MSTNQGSGRAFAAMMGRVGVWSFGLQTHSAAEEQAAVAELEAMGYPALWIPESLESKEALSHAAILLAGSRRIVVATGIASIYVRDAMAMANGARTLAEAYPERFVLGLGVSHAPSVERRGGSYGRPVESMRAYLDAMDDARFSGPMPQPPVFRVLAALGPRMLELAAQRASGAHPYFVPVEHTVVARRQLGPDPFLAVEVTAVLDSDPGRARAVAREFARRYLALENYAKNLRRLGYGDDDLAEGGSDRLIDAVVASGGLEAVSSRIRAHLDAGADHVCVQLRSSDPTDLCLDGYRSLAAALLPTVSAVRAD